MMEQTRKSGLAGLAQGIAIENPVTRPNPLKEVERKKRCNLRRFWGVNYGLLELPGEPEPEPAKMKMSYLGAMEYFERLR